MAIYLPQTLEMLVGYGVNITIENNNYLPQTLLNLVTIAKRTGAHITISGSYFPQTLEQLARIGGNNLTLIVNLK